MKNYNLANFLLLRTPNGTAPNYTLDIHTILKDEVFMSALAVASPAFYHQISHTADPDTKSRLALRKYYNRYCFRPTPFGLFSTITPLNWNNGHITSVQQKRLVYAELDNHFAYLLGQRLIDKATTLWEPNPTLYRVQRELRFVRTDTAADSGKRQYLLQATDHTPLLQRLLRFCEAGRDSAAVTGFISAAGHCDNEEAAEYLNFLQDAQVLLPVLRPNITGKDHLRLLYEQVAKHPEIQRQQDLLSQLLAKTGTLQDLDTAVLTRLLDLASRVSETEAYPAKALLSIISVKRSVEQRPDGKVEQALQQGLQALRKLSIPVRRRPLDQFIERFNKAYENQTIPLLAILDPETGIGYGDPEKEKNNPLLETADIRPRQTGDNRVPWTKTHRLLLNAWHAPNAQGRQVIELTKEMLEGLPETDTDLRCSGFAVLFRTDGEVTWIESAGGYHTNGLIGRLTVADPAICDSARQMALREQQLNPDVIFAEILHLADLPVDNVNRRETLLDREIPLTATSTLPKDQQLGLSDLYVSVVNGKVLLSSKKHRKLVLPRLSSAYNHQLNQLPLFRFLADLPYQFSSPVRSLDLQELFPGLNFYPRVVYQNVILSPAQWLLAPDEVRAIAADPELFLPVSAKLEIPRVFALAQGDQHLVFDSHKREEVLFFAACINRSENVRLQEVFLDQAEGQVISQQFTAFVLPSAPLGIGFPINSHRKLPKIKRRFMPGSEWLYLKIYTSRLGTNDLLRQLAPYFKRQLRLGTVTKWFFVRYEDHAPHIRVRLLVTGVSLGTALNDLRRLFERKVEQQVIREYQVDTYSRELERYGVADYAQVEDFFWASSELSLRYIRRNKATTENEPYLFALQTTDALLQTAFTSEPDRIAYCYDRFQQFSAEFGNRKIHVELDKLYRSLRSPISTALSGNNPAPYKGFGKVQKACITSFAMLIEQADQESAQFRLLVSSLVHMHLNRLFTTESRKQEMIVFYLLYKHGFSAVQRRMSGQVKHQA